LTSDTSRESSTSETAARRGVFGGTNWPIGRVAGIQISIDQSWVPVFLLVTFSASQRLGADAADDGALARWTASIATSLLFFASILLHELGHSLVALRLGVRVRSITLFLFGGIATLEEEAHRPRDEVLIAVAGPLVSFALGFGLVGFADLVGEDAGLLHTAASWLGTINYTLAIFNLVPGFPLDGGRVLRGLVWAKTGRFEYATRIAANAGAVFAWSVMGLGALIAVTQSLFSGLWLAFIGWFVLSAGRQTLNQVVLERVLGRIAVTDAMEPIGGAIVDASDTVQHVADTAVMGLGRRTFLITGARGELEGLLTLRELAATPPEQRATTAIRDVMVPAASVMVLDAAATGWDALKRMAEGGVNQLPVVATGRVVGLVTRERLLGLVQAGIALQPR